MLNEWPRHWATDAQNRLIADLVCDLACTLRLDAQGQFVREWTSREQFLGYETADLRCGVSGQADEDAFFERRERRAAFGQGP